jgi:acetylornithine deacetylase/succinyl-diaminopimelate desuccinylase-like protein
MSISDPDLETKRRRHRYERAAAALLVMISSIAVLLFIRWNRMEEQAMRGDLTYVPRPQKITPEILLLREFVRIDTSTVEGVAEGAQWLAQRLREGGVEPEIIESTPGRLNVHARIEGRNPGEGLLLFNHIDVVPPGEGWEDPPFEGVMRLNMLYGRGVLDMKALTICQLLAFLEIAQSGRQPDHDLAFLATAEEERGSVEGMQWLIANRPDLFEGIAYGITEGGITEMFTEKITYFGIEVGGKRHVTVEVEADTIEAAREARIALEPHLLSREPERVLPEVAAYFRRIAPTRVSFGDLLANLDDAIAAGAFWQLPLAYRDLTQNSVWASAPLESEHGAKMTVRMQNLPDENPDERIGWLQQHLARFGARIGNVTHRDSAVPLSPVDTRLFEILASEARERYDTAAGAQILYRSANDSRFLRSLGIVSYGISPYPVDFDQSRSIHAANERIRLDHFMEGIGYLARVIERWCFASDN